MHSTEIVFWIEGGVWGAAPFQSILLARAWKLKFSLPYCYCKWPGAATH